jgi:hypothetical protein
MKLLKKFLVLMMLSGSLFYVTNVNAQIIIEEVTDWDCYSSCSAAMNTLCGVFYIPAYCNDSGSACYSHCTHISCGRYPC